MLRFGVIACSSIARRRFLPALKNSSVAQLHHVGSREANKASQFARDFGAGKFGSYDDVLRDPEVDAVYISTPISQHVEWVLRAAEQGKHVLCEKPLCASLADTITLVETCREKRVRLMEAYSYGFHPQHAVARQWISAGRIGRPTFFNGEFTFPKPPEGDVRLKPELNGGVFHDALGYPVAAAMLMFDAAPEMVSCALVLDPRHGVDCAASVRLDFSEGRTAHCYAGFGLQYRSRYAVTGTRGRIECERAYSVLPDKATTMLLESGNDMERVETGPADQFSLMIEEFAGQITGVRPDLDLEGRALRQALVMDCALRSAREQRFIEVPRL